MEPYGGSRPAPGTDSSAMPGLPVGNVKGELKGHSVTPPPSKTPTTTTGTTTSNKPTTTSTTTTTTTTTTTQIANAIVTNQSRQDQNTQQTPPPEKFTATPLKSDSEESQFVSNAAWSKASYTPLRDSKGSVGSTGSRGSTPKLRTRYEAVQVGDGKEKETATSISEGSPLRQDRKTGRDISRESSSPTPLRQDSKTRRDIYRKSYTPTHRDLSSLRRNLGPSSVVEEVQIPLKSLMDGALEKDKNFQKNLLKEAIQTEEKLSEALFNLKDICGFTAVESRKDLAKRELFSKLEKSYSEGYNASQKMIKALKEFEKGEATFDEVFNPEFYKEYCTKMFGLQEAMHDLDQFSEDKDLKELFNKKGAGDLFRNLTMKPIQRPARLIMFVNQLSEVYQKEITKNLAIEGQKEEKDRDVGRLSGLTNLQESIERTTTNIQQVMREENEMLGVRDKSRFEKLMNQILNSKHDFCFVFKDQELQIKSLKEMEKSLKKEDIRKELAIGKKAAMNKLYSITTLISSSEGNEREKIEENTRITEQLFECLKKQDKYTKKQSDLF